MSLATQPHISHSQRSFSAPRSDARTRKRWGSRPWKHRETMGIISTKSYFSVDGESISLDVAWEDPLLPMSPSMQELELKLNLETWKEILHICHLLEYIDCKTMESMMSTTKSILAKDADPHFYVLISSYLSTNRMFSFLVTCQADSTEFFSDSDTITNPVECTIWKRLIEPNPESYKRQQQAPQEKRPCRKPYHKNKVQNESFKSTKLLTRDDTILEIVDDLEQNPLSSLQIETKVEWRMARGRSSLKNWRRAAGKSKSWKPYLKSTVPKQTHLNRRRRNSSGVGYRSAQPPPWLPAVFLRSQTTEKSLWPGYVLRRQETNSVPRRARCHDPYTHDFEDTPIAPYGNHRTTAARNVKTREFGPDIFKNMNGEPAGAFIRFTWKDGILANGTGQLDRFLATSSILHSHWHITGFLRNESFADVYSLNRPPFALSSVEIPDSLEAHVFLDEYHGNCAVYASRSKNRMRQSGNCLETFWHNGRHVFVMKIAKKPILFKLRNTKEKFPALVNQDKCNERVALHRRLFRDRPSFAAMAASGWPDASSECRSVLMNEVHSALEKELERIEGVRVKKAERQRVRRKLQREKKLVKKQ